MKLFLSALSIGQDHREYFTRLVGKEFADLSFALIENAADPYPQEKRGFVYETRGQLMSLGMHIELVDLRLYKKDTVNDLYSRLRSFDVVWFGGGNTFYLRSVMRSSGFDRIVVNLLEDGVVYGRGSAGAIVIGPTLEHFDLIDDPKESPELIYEGLGMTNRILIPHWGTPKYQDKLDSIRLMYETAGREVILLQDHQAVMVENDHWQVIPEH